LNYLSKPARIDELTKVFSDEYGRDLDRQLACLREKGLLFEEGDRLMSLVLNGERKTQEPVSSSGDAAVSQMKVLISSGLSTR
jgi:hypothetical protein